MKKWHVDLWKLARHNGDSKFNADNLNLGNVNYNLNDLSQRSDAEYQMRDMYNAGALPQSDRYSFTNNTSNMLVGGETGIAPGTGSFGLQPPVDWGDPIGAFYDSQSYTFDNAASIAHKTARATNASGQALSKAQLMALDANGDGQLSVAEASGVRLWADMTTSSMVISIRQ